MIPEIEIDCFAEGLQLHILGYGIDIANDKLMKLERSVLEMQRGLSLKQMDAIDMLDMEDTLRFRLLNALKLSTK